MEYFNIDDFPDYRLVRESEKDFYVESCKKGEWEKIGSDISNDGHIYVTLFNDKYKRATYLHVLIAETFIPNPEDKEIAHHIDGDASNNNPSNLMWVTRSQHRSIHNKLDNPMWHEESRKKNSEAQRGKSNLMKNMRSQPTRKRIVSLNIATGEIVEYESIRDAARRTGVDRKNISLCCRGILKTAGGYKWRYAD